MMMSIQFAGVRFYKMVNEPQPSEDYQAGYIELDPNRDAKAQLQAIEAAKTDYEARCKATMKSLNDQVEARMTALAEANQDNPDYMAFAEAQYRSGLGLLVIDGPDLPQYLMDIHRTQQRNLKPYADQSKYLDEGGPRRDFLPLSRQDVQALPTPTTLNWARARSRYDVSYALNSATAEVQERYLQRAEVIDIVV